MQKDDILDITEDDHDAYYANEGREIYGSAQEAMLEEEQMIAKLLMFSEANSAKKVPMLCDYSLDIKLDPEAIN